MKIVNYENYVKPSDYVKFHEGENVIRVLTKLAMGQTVGLRMGGMYRPLGWIEGKEAQSAVSRGAKVKNTWRWVVYDYQTKQVRLLDAGVDIGDKLATLGKTVDLLANDVVITATGQGLKRRYPTVVKALQNGNPPTRVEVEPEVRYLVQKYMTVQE